MQLERNTGGPRLRFPGCPMTDKRLALAAPWHVRARPLFASVRGFTAFICCRGRVIRRANATALIRDARSIYDQMIAAGVAKLGFLCLRQPASVRCIASIAPERAGHSPGARTRGVLAFRQGGVTWPGPAASIRCVPMPAATCLPPTRVSVAGRSYGGGPIAVVRLFIPISDQPPSARMQGNTQL
jgi:hypothetical protein